ncbi:MAG: hypothetical protein KDA75_04785, partial [Planctomycetaceae bacterium]|nr:hypothetical protein [Planctomycetaceae bacterium]
MSEFTPLIPPIQIDATSYAADDVDREEDLLVAPDESQRPAAAMARPSPLAPLDPPLTPQGGAPPVAQAAIPQPRRTRRRSKARALFDRIAQRHNEFWELFLGPFAGAGWLVSLFMHAAAVTALAFILVGRNPKEAPHIIIGTESTATESGVGDLVSEISIENERVPQESASALLANGGSTGQLAPDFAAAFGAPVGKGQGQGRGGGDGMGDEIAGRVRAAGGKAGNLQISLAWNDRNDLDLHLVTPDGRRLFYATPRSEDGGTLDVDMNVNAESTTPVENITWGAATPS